MVWIRSPISNSSTLPYQTFRDRSKRTICNWYHRYPYVLMLSLFSSKVLVLFSFSPFLWISFCGPFGRQSPLYGKFASHFFVCVYVCVLIITVWSSGQHKLIRRYLKISEICMHLILQDGFSFVYISFGCIIKFQFLAQFPLDHLSHPVVSSLGLPLR